MLDYSLPSTACNCCITGKFFWGYLRLGRNSKGLKVEGLDIYIPPLTGKPEQQRFTMQSCKLTSISSIQCSTISGHPLLDEWTFDPQSAARQTHLCPSHLHYGLYPAMFSSNNSIFNSEYYQALIELLVVNNWSTSFYTSLLLSTNSLPLVRLCLCAFHVTPALKQRHWLRIKSRTVYKLCLLMHNIHTGQAPQYLVDCVSPMASSSSLRLSLRSSHTAKYAKHTMQTKLGWSSSLECSSC